MQATDLSAPRHHFVMASEEYRVALNYVKFSGAFPTIVFTDPFFPSRCSSHRRRTGPGDLLEMVLTLRSTAVPMVITVSRGDQTFQWRFFLGLMTPS